MHNDDMTTDEIFRKYSRLAIYIAGQGTNAPYFAPYLTLPELKPSYLGVPKRTRPRPYQPDQRISLQRAWDNIIKDPNNADPQQLMKLSQKNQLGLRKNEIEFLIDVAKRFGPDPRRPHPLPPHTLLIGQDIIGASSHLREHFRATYPALEGLNNWPGADDQTQQIYSGAAKQGIAGILTSSRGLVNEALATEQEKGRGPDIIFLDNASFEFTPNAEAIAALLIKHKEAIENLIARPARSDLKIASVGLTEGFKIER